MAHTPAEYESLARYFTLTSRYFEAKAAEQEEELRRNNGMIIGGSKYPTASEHARTFLSLYRQKSREAKQRALEFSAKVAEMSAK